MNVSVIIPTYNRRSSLKKTIETVLSQSHQDFELLICDDGSTDGTEDMVKQFEDTRIRWIPGENSGSPAVPRNRGIQASETEWLAFLDSDDLWMPDKLEKQLVTVKQHHVQAVCTNAKVLRNNMLSEDPYFRNTRDKYLTFDDLLTVNQVICSSMLIHKSIVSQIGGFPEGRKYKAIEDYALWLSASMLTDIYYLDEPLTIYRDEPQESIRGDVPQSEWKKYDNRIIMECLRRIVYVDNRSRYIKKLLFGYIKKNIISFKKRF